METSLKHLIGKKIKQIFLNQEMMKFVTDAGDFVYSVSGDCCSHSYIHDFYGVEKLLKNGEVTDVKRVELTKDDKSYIGYSPEDRGDNDSWDYIACYGYQIFVNDPEWGEVTACFSFRNSSNGYYGGSIDKVFPYDENEYIPYDAPRYTGTENLIEITSDVVDVSKITL